MLLSGRLLGKVIEDLLQGGLVNAVLTYLIEALDVLHHAEQVPNGVSIPANFDLPGRAIVFDDLKILELALKEVEGFLASSLGELPSHELVGVDPEALSEVLVEFKAYLIGLDERNDVTEAHIHQKLKAIFLIQRLTVL